MAGPGRCWLGGVDVHLGPLSEASAKGRKEAPVSGKVNLLLRALKQAGSDLSPAVNLENLVDVHPKRHQRVNWVGQQASPMALQAITSNSWSPNGDLT